MRILHALMLLLAGLPGLAQEAKTPPNKAQELVEKAVAALGGEAYLNVTGYIRTGRIYSFSRGELASAGAVFTEYAKYPDKSRMEYYRNRSIIQVNNGDEGWELDTQGVREQTPESIRDFKESVKRDIDFLLRARRTEPGMQFYYLGSQFLDNRRVEVVEMVDAENESLVLYLDAETHLPLRLRYRERDELTREMVEVVEYYGIYIDFDGVRSPRQITRERARIRVFEATELKVDFKAPIAEELFTRESLEARWQEIGKKEKKKKKKDEEEP